MLKTKGTKRAFLFLPILFFGFIVGKTVAKTKTNPNSAATFTKIEGGRVFLQYSERILALCEESCRALNDVKNGDRGNLTVGASQTIGTYLMPRVLAPLI